MFFNNIDKVGINFIKNSYAFHMLLKKVTPYQKKKKEKKVTHVIFIE
jgi:hypothetical protein